MNVIAQKGNSRVINSIHIKLLLSNKANVENKLQMWQNYRWNDVTALGGYRKLLQNLSQIFTFAFYHAS